MAGNPRQLAHGEKRMPVFTSEKGRDRAAASRAIEGLTQNDQIIALLFEQNQMLTEQNQMLRYLADSAHWFMERQSGPPPTGPTGAV
jgi:hypothetical protein